MRFVAWGRAALALVLLAAGWEALASVTVSGQFTPLSIVQGDRTRMRINFQSNDVVNPVTAANFNNVLPAPITLYPTNFPGYQAPTSTCNSTTQGGQTLDTSPAYVTTTGNNRVDLVNGIVPIAPSAQVSGSCFIEVDVTVATGPTLSYTNTLVRTNFTATPPVAVDGTTDPQFSLNVTGLSSITASKTFGANPLIQGNTTSVTITITNPNATTAIPLIAFSDTLPANLAVVGLPSASCPGGTNPTVTSVTDANPISIAGGVLAAGGTCTITATVRGVLPPTGPDPTPVSRTATNDIAVNAVDNTRRVTLDLAVSTPITVNTPVTVTKTFTPNPLSVGAAGTATIRIDNASSAPLTGLTLTDTVASARWPAQIDNTGAPTLSGCGPADVVAGPGGPSGRGFVLGGVTTGSIAGGGSCTITIPITSNTVSVNPADWTNDIPLGAVGNAQGFFSRPASARLDVRDVTPQVGKTVSPTSAAPGDLVRYTVDVTTFNPQAQNNVSFTDTLPGGMTAILSPVPGASAPTISGPLGCTLSSVTGSTAAPTFTFNMPAAAAGGSTCTVTFFARVPAAAVPGSTIAANATGAITNPGGGINSPSVSSAPVNVLPPLAVQKQFNGAASVSLSQGTPVQMSITLTNNTFTALTNAAFTDTLPTSPGNLVVANPPNASSTCGGTVTAVPGAGTVSLSGGTIPARNGGSFAAGTCVIRVNVVGGTASSAPGHTNTIPAGGVTASVPAASPTFNAGGATPVQNVTAASASVQYTPALTVAKSFLTNPVNVGGSSRVRIVLGNNGGGVLTNVGVDDPVASIAGITLASPPNAATTCAGPTSVSTAGGNVSLRGATIPNGTTCDLLFDVVATSAGTSTNTLPPGSVFADGGVVFPDPVSATLTKQAGAVALTKNFTPNAINSPGQPSRLQITISNTGALTLTALALPDSFPSGMKVAAVPNASTTCPGGTVTAVAGATSIALSGATLAPAQSCTVDVDVAHLVLGALTNTLPVGAITTAQGISNTTPFSANLASQQNLGAQKSFSPRSAPPNTPVRMTITINNTLGSPLAGISFVDTFPTGMQVAATPNAASTCGGSFAPAAGATSISHSGGSLPVGPSSCTLSVDVIGTTLGALANVLAPGSITANGGAVTNPSPAVTATLNVLNPPVLAKAFAPSPTRAGGVSRLTITINNPNTTALTEAALTDTLPSGVFVAPVPNTASTCAGATVDAAPSGTSVRLTGATIPAGAPGTCTVSVDTVSNAPGSYVNTLPAGAIATAQGATNAAPASATLQVFQFPTLAKGFAPAVLQAGGVSVLTLTLGNPNGAAITLASALDDALPTGLVVAPAPGITGTCPGLPGNVTAAAGATTVRVNSGASIPAGGCTVSVNVTSPTSGTFTNVIPAGALVTTQAGANPAPATANVVFSDLGTIGGTVYRDLNNDGSVNGGDSGIAGQTVELLDAGGAVIQTAITDPSGSYLFTGLVAGTYSVRQPAQPAGTLDGKATAGTTFVNGTGTAGTATPAGQATTLAPSRINGIVLNLAAGVVASSTGNNFGELPASRVTGRVYRDLNGNGGIDSGEAGIAGVAVTLSGFDDLGNAVSIATTTDSAGDYAFTGLRPSCGSAGATACPGGNPAGYTITEGAQPTGTANGRESAGSVTDIATTAAVGTSGTISNNTAPAFGNAPAGTSRIAGILLPANAQARANNFGEIPADRSVAGRVFTDINGNGTADGSDAGVGAGAAGANNVAQTLTLTGTTVGNVAVNLTTTTDASGNYSFANLQPGTYTVTCSTCNPPAGLVNGPAYPGTTGGTAGGSTAAPAITAIDLTGAAATASTANNFTKTQGNGAISGRVYVDNDNNGLFDGSDTGIAGQTVRLLDSNGVQVSTTTTAADGTYAFNGLTAGTYTVEEPTQPAGTSNGITSAGTINGTGTAGTATNPATAPSRIAAITLQSVAGTVATSPGNNFGELPNTRSVSGRVFVDRNGDGLFNTLGGTDVGVGGAATPPNNVAQTLTLTGNDLSGNAVTRTATTDANGQFSFANLPPGTNYTLTCTTCAAPAGLQNGSAYAGSVNGSLAGTAGGTQAVPVIAGINLGPAANLASINNHFTKIAPAQQISGFVFFDPNNNGGIKEPGDAPVPGQSVQLQDAAGTTVLATATTDADGYYAFSSVTTAALVPGTYRVRLNAAPAGTNIGSTSAGTINGVTTGTPSAQGVAPAVISAIAVGANQQSIANNFPVVANLAIGGTVYDDRNLSGTFDGGDAGIAGVTLTLTGTDAFGNAVNRTATTAGGGTYSFANLAPGSYVVTQTQPNGFVSVANSAGTVVGGTAGAVGALGGATETVAINLTGPTGGAAAVNFGERQTTGSVRGFKSVANQTRPAVQPSIGDVLVWTISYRNESAGTLPLQIRDTLPATLTRSGAPAITLSTSGTVTGATLNPAWNGSTVTDLLQPGATFAAGAVITINLPVIVLPSASGTISNQAFHTGTATTVPSSQVDNTTAGLPAGVTVPAGSLPQTAGTAANPNNQVPTVVRVGAVPASLSGTVWRDNNGDKKFDSGLDTPIPGWGVALYDSSGALIACTAFNSTAGCVTMPDGKSLFRTDANGAYGVNGIAPGRYRIEFRDPSNNVLFGNPKDNSGDPVNKDNTKEALFVDLVSGQNKLRQDLPLDPSGVVYDAVSRLPIAGARVELCGPAGFAPASMLVGGASYTVSGNCASMVTGATGFYQYLLSSTAPAGTYTIGVTAPGFGGTPSSAIPPAASSFTPAGPSPLLVQAQAGPPAVGQPTTYYLSFNLGPGVPDVIHNHIALDPFTGAGLFLQKAVDRVTVELGDSVQYTLRVNSPNGAAAGVTISDRLPAGFRLIPGTVIVNGARAPDPAGSPGPVLSFAVGALAANVPTTITYRVRVGVGAQQGDGINRARAAGTVAGLAVSSNEARARVRITGGVFFQEACVVGKIFVDCDNNRIQDAGEPGIPGVRLYLHDGTYLVSDVEGKYSYCGLPARTGAIKVDPATLPPGSQLVTSSNRNALDAGSLFLDLRIGELHRADFIEGSCSAPVLDAVQARRAAGSVAAPAVEKRAQPRLIFDSGAKRQTAPVERAPQRCTDGRCAAPAEGAR